MEIQELRIGNIVYANGLHEGKELTVRELRNNEHEQVVFFKGHKTGEYVKDCAGIPLTKEWLTRFGFSQSDEHENGCNTNEDFGFYYDYHFRIFWLDAGNYRTKLSYIKYVHQLQNLYYALTGTELTCSNIVNP